MSARIVSIWLMICCLMVYAMILVGGITRLTESGLSMVSWAPLMGILPPLNPEQWQQTFQDYQNYPEYQKVNTSMTLEGFKRIFWWEYIHRLLGRLIGLVFFLPLVFFTLTNRIKKSSVPVYIGLFILGGLQGLMGWYMVKSGLVDDPNVSQYRLTAHLSLAVLIYGLLLWQFLTHGQPAKVMAGSFRYRGSFWIKGLIAMIALMIVSGGFMAGTKAGHIYNTFPKMGNTWFPDQLFVMVPVWKNIFENTVTIQFQHRYLALITFMLIVGFYIYMRQTNVRSIKAATNILLVLAIVQVLLGIVTLVLGVPVLSAVLHQGTAILLLSGAIYTAYQIKYKT